MKIIKKKLSELKTAQYNPRIDISKDQVFYRRLFQSIEKFGYIEPIIWNKRTGNVVGGNQRLQILKDTNIEEVDVVEVDLPLDEEKALNIALNKINGDWDEEKLENLLLELKTTNEDLLDFTGFNEKELEHIIQLPLIEENYDLEQAIQREPVYNVTRGDIYQLGNHRLMCGDSTSYGDIKRLCDGKNIDMAFYSPPYNVGHNLGYDNKDSKYISDDNNQNYLELLTQSTDNAIKTSKYLFLNIQYLSNNKIDFINFLNQYKNNISDIAIWHKQHSLPAFAMNVMNSDYEFIIIIKNEQKPKRKIKINKEFRGTVSNVYYGERQNKNEYSDIHNATYPLEFPNYFINSFTEQKSNILDLFGGTGTTLILCEQTNRCCYMMEIEPHYCSVIIERWEKLTNKKHVKL